MKRTMKEWSDYFGIPYSDVCSAMSAIKAYGKRNQAFEEALVRKRLKMHYERILARAMEREARCSGLLRRIETGKACETCRYDLGGGYDNCRINLEAECGAGGFEAWEPKEEPAKAGSDADTLARMLAQAMASTGTMSKEIIGIAMARPVEDLFEERRD